MEIKIDTYAEDTFKLACLHDQKDIAEWLYNLQKTDKNKKIDIYSDNDNIFNGYLS